MSNKTRKHIWPVSLVMSIAIIGALAAFLVLASNPGETQAHGEWVEGTPHCPRIADEIAHNEGTFDHTCTEGPNNAPMAATATLANQTVEPDGTVMVQSTITDADAGDTLEWTVSSSDEDVATVIVSSTGMVTVTGIEAGTATITVSATDGTASAMQTFMVTVTSSEPPPGKVTSSSTSGSATVELKLTVTVNQPVPVGGAIVLYLEDDYQEPDSISASDVYFVVDPGHNNTDLKTGNGARVYATQSPEIDTDDHFTKDKKDIDIRVSLPDLCTTDTPDCQDLNGLMPGDTVTMVIQKSAGIKNPSEEGTHSTGYLIVGPADSVPGSAAPDNQPFVITDVLNTWAKISLSDVDNSRGYELTVTGSGFNNGTSAAVHVLGHARYETAKWWETLNCDGMKAALGKADSATNEACFHFDVDDTNKSYKLSDPLRAHDDFKALDAAGMKMYTDMVFSQHLCRIIIQEGARAGIATVGSDDKVAVSFEVTVPTFVPGNNNYICMVDGEGRASSRDVEDFNLEPSIRVVPSSAAAGDSITVFAQDYTGGSFEQLLIAGQVVNSSTVDLVSVSATNIGNDGSATATFDLPGSVAGSALEGTVRIDATWGGVKEDTKITITGSQLNLSKSEALPNELITITGDGFGGDYIDVMNITIDGAPLMVDSDSMHRMGSMNVVDVSNAGQFVASVVLWPQSVSGSNPSLIAGTHTIDVEDDAGFSGSAVIVIPDASISVTPTVAGPRDIITITGENWPIDNVDGAAPPAVDIKISDGSRTRRYSAFADSAGRFTVEHRVASDVAIPSTNQVRAEMGTDIVKVGSFEVPAAIINIEPAEGQPGDHIILSVDGMPVYQQVDRVEIGGRSVLPVGNFSTDSNGSVTVDQVLIPGLDPGTYSVLLDVEDTIAIGELNVLAETGAVGPAAELPGAVENLGDSLVAIFYFDDVGKNWSFYDPRPEFADLNTLSELVNGEAYWIMVSETVEDAVLNNKARSLTCRGDDCWNLEVW